MVKKTQTKQVKSAVVAKTITKKNKKRNSNNYHHFISKLSKDLNPNVSISNTGLNALNDIFVYTLKNIAENASDLAQKKGTCTLTEKNIQNYLSMRYPHQFYRKIHTKYVEASKKYLESMSK